MNLVLVYLIEERYLTDVLLAMAGVFENRAVVTDAVAGPDQLAASIPIFSDFSSAAGPGTTFCKVIHTVTKVQDAAQRLNAALLEGGIDFRKERLGTICVVALEQALIAEPEG